MPVKAYFIGGSLDLSARMMPRHETPAMIYHEHLGPLPPFYAGTETAPPRRRCVEKERYVIIVQSFNGPWGNYVVYAYDGTEMVNDVEPS